MEKIRRTVNVDANAINRTLANGWPNDTAVLDDNTSVLRERERWTGKRRDGPFRIGNCDMHVVSFISRVNTTTSADRKSVV